MDPLSIENSADALATRTTAIREATLRDSWSMRSANFNAIDTSDVARLFRLSDQHYFSGWLEQTILERNEGPLLFRLSQTKRRAGGTTTRMRLPRPEGGFRYQYEIAIASRLLFMTFGSVERPVTVVGFNCTDRLDALQRIVEHEMIHLLELLVWGRSSCKANRFATLARRIFGHTQATHQLVTPEERAAVQHGIRLGDLVQFSFEGATHTGRVNRIHVRATVLVESTSGMRYSDGKHYTKYYVPLESLQRVH